VWCGAAAIRKWIVIYDLRPKRDTRYKNEEWLKEQYCQLRRRSQNIAADCRCGHSEINAWVLKHGLKRRRYGSYAVNDDYFEQIDNQEKAYWLGFLAADGCVDARKGKGLLSLTLAEKDKGHIELFRRCVNTAKPIYTYTKKYPNARGTFNISCTLNITSRKMVEDLIRHGVVERKTKILKPPQIWEKLIPHWVRGYFDGDGSVRWNRAAYIQK